MRAGRLRHRITIRTYSYILDTYGQETRTYVDGDTVWGAVEPTTGSERLQALQLSAEVSHEITMRHVTLNPKDRLVFESRIFEVVSIKNPEERDIETRAYCKETIE